MQCVSCALTNHQPTECYLCVNKKKRVARNNKRGSTNLSITIYQRKEAKEKHCASFLSIFLLVYY